MTTTQPTHRGAASRTSALYEGLRQAILSIDLAPGERLTERGLEAAFAASRTPVRAALSRLESEGLAQRDGRGWIVAPIDLDEIRAVAEFREATETAGVRLAAERVTPDGLATLGALLDAGQLASDEHQGVRAGGEFHSELAALSGNALLRDAVRGAMTRLERTRWLEVRTAAAREKAWREHRAILDAVGAGRGDEAAALLVAHIRGTNERLVAQLSSESRRLRGRGLSIVGS